MLAEFMGPQAEPWAADNLGVALRSSPVGGYLDARATPGSPACASAAAAPSSSRAPSPASTAHSDVSPIGSRPPGSS